MPLPYKDVYRIILSDEAINEATRILWDHGVFKSTPKGATLIVDEDTAMEILEKSEFLDPDDFIDKESLDILLSDMSFEDIEFMSDV